MHVCMSALPIFQVKKYGKPTWRKLVEAVQNKVGGYNHVLAQKIAAEHRGVPSKNVH